MHAIEHELLDAVGARFVQLRDDIDEHDASRRTGCDLAFEQHRGAAAERRADDKRSDRKSTRATSRDIERERGQRIVAGFVPVALPVTTRVEGDRAPASASERRRSATPRVPRLAASVQQQHSGSVGVTPAIAHDRDALVTDEGHRFGLRRVVTE